MPYWIGVDGGGTGTRARLEDSGGRTLGHGESGPSALSQGVGQAWRHVQQAIAAAFHAAGVAPVPALADVALGLGLAGAGVASQRAAFLEADPGYRLCVLDNDGITQLLGAHAGRPGVVVAAGTGSVAAARYADGSVRQIGGWGFPVGDEGSGAWLGLRAVQAAQAALDGRGPAGPMTQAVLEHSGGGREALLAWCAGADAHDYASLAPLVFAAAARHDAAAQALLRAAAGELATLVGALQAAAMTSAEPVLRPQPRPGVPPQPVSASVQPTPLPLVVRGSIGERLAGHWPAALQALLVEPAGDSADGALQLVRSAALQSASAVGRGAG